MLNSETFLSGIARKWYGIKLYDRPTNTWVEWKDNPIKLFCASSCAIIKYFSNKYRKVESWKTLQVNTSEPLANVTNDLLHSTCDPTLTANEEFRNSMALPEHDNVTAKREILRKLVYEATDRAAHNVVCLLKLEHSSKRKKAIIIRNWKEQGRMNME